jgi:hypothetical protein
MELPKSGSTLPNRVICIDFPLVFVLRSCFAARIRTVCFLNSRIVNCLSLLFGAAEFECIAKAHRVK